MKRVAFRGGPASPARMRGLSLIEVLMSVLVLGLGLLGLAMLQTTNLRLAQSSNQRTIATNLSNDLLDDIRTNRLIAIQYNGTYKADGVTATDCTKTGAMTPKDQTDEFTCRMKQALGASAIAVVQVNTTTGRVSIKLDWDDAKRWKVLEGATSFSMETAL
ncbi:type IV pilus modification protein PilV [Lysobacter enzymogenes]|uniref:type IV pilus modification protein PilV n=1 Tax=Lysobacter enzymogenes TaxID=69 RepID=UPI003850A284